MLVGRALCVVAFLLCVPVGALFVSVATGVVGIVLGIVGYLSGARGLGRLAVVLCTAARFLGLLIGQGAIPGSYDPVLDGVKQILQDPLDGETNREAGPGGSGARQCRATPPETLSVERYAGGRAWSRSGDMPGSRQEWRAFGTTARAERVEFRPPSAPGGDPVPDGGPDPEGQDSALRTSLPRGGLPGGRCPCRRGARPPRRPKKRPHKNSRSREPLPRSPEEQSLRLESAKLGERS